MNALEFQPDALFGGESDRKPCPRCRSPLQLHQPDPSAPERLLAVCEDCHAWYLMDPRGLLTMVPAMAPERSRRSKHETR
jgi:uncharacterized protein YbaR (Trm112 family)